jgi:RimJ/RimL family protein N-acetyltransferase
MQPILLDIPDTLDTARLILRCPRPGDGPLLFDAIRASLDELRRFPASLPWALAEPSIDDSEAFARTGCANFIARRDFPFMMVSKASGACVGWAGLHGPDWTVRAFEAGWWGRTSELGAGLISEGVTALLAFAFETLGARRVEARVDPRNLRCERLCERIGMQLEGTLRQSQAEPDGTLVDTRVYAAVRHA